MRFFILLLAATCAVANLRYASVVFENDKLLVREGLECRHSSVAFASYNDTISSNGWGFLTVESNSAYSDELQMRAVGLVEGFLTQKRIYQYKLNMWDHTNGFENGTPQKLIDFLQQQTEWQRAMVGHYVDTDLFWYQVGLTLNQLDGMVEGYNTAAPKDQNLPFIEMLIITAEGDLYELMPSLNITSMPQTEEELSVSHSCSALIRVAPDLSDIWISHNTWTYYGAMLRLHKTFSLGLNPSKSRNRKFAFTSKPGYLFSKDDAYVTSTGLVVQETTISMNNPDLYHNIVHKTVLTWARAMIALRSAQSPENWTQMFRKYNSGTYCNQWMVVDTNGFVPGRGLMGLSFYIIEQLPGMTHVEDVSSVVRRQGYWPSYNIPFSKVIYNQAGYPELKKKYGDQYDYDKCPRARIFARDAPKVSNYLMFKELMRSNNFETDPLSLGSPKNAIASRYDLDKENPRAHGAIDAKVMRLSSPKTLAMDIISGPTWSGKREPFSWSKRPEFKDLHEGQPDTFNFDWVLKTFKGSMC
ncbi:hypothetical protein P9112_002935 [Eukaryota sp. TZLM1-RC]